MPKELPRPIINRGQGDPLEDPVRYHCLGRPHPRRTTSTKHNTNRSHPSQPANPNAVPSLPTGCGRRNPKHLARNHRYNTRSNRFVIADSASVKSISALVCLTPKDHSVSPRVSHRVSRRGKTRKRTFRLNQTLPAERILARSTSEPGRLAGMEPAAPRGPNHSGPPSLQILAVRSYVPPVYAESVQFGQS